jgi:hypothetical protein
MENFLRLGGAIDITSRKKNAQDLKKGKGRGRLSVVPLPQNVEDTLAKVSFLCCCCCCKISNICIIYLRVGFTFRGYIRSSRI